jgi:abequosyltransferase
MRVSICIPTYNRADKLPRLLDSIAGQIGYDLEVEVVISDNASTDDTAALVERYKVDGLTIVYDRLPENRGFDRNLLNAIERASGTFCWLFGSDDFLEPGALAALEQTLTRHRDAAGVSIGLQAYSPDLKRQLFLDDHISTDFADETVLVGRGDIIARIGACFGFMSSVVIRRPYLLGYIHTYVIARLLDDQSCWIVLPLRLVGYRTSEASISSTNEFARTRLDIVGYDLAFGDTLGRDHWAYRRAMRMVAVYAISIHFINAKLSGASAAYWREAVPTTLSYYWRYPGFWMRTLPIALVPRPLLLGARTIYQHTLKPLRARRATRRSST